MGSVGNIAAYSVRKALLTAAHTQIVKERNQLVDNAMETILKLRNGWDCYGSIGSVWAGPRAADALLWRPASVTVR